MVDILGIGASSLSAYRTMLETVSTNIANANTDGYVRRDTVLSTTGNSPMLPTSSGATEGSGVMVDMVRRANDAFLQAQTLKANAADMQGQTLSDSLTQLEKSLFTTTNNPGSVVQDFFSRFSDVANAPTDTAARQTVLDAGQTVAQMFTGAAGAINDTLTNVRSGLDAALGQVNTITSQLAKLNVQIQSESATGQQPNDLLDQRDKLLSSLSNLANFSFTTQSSGAVTVYLGDTASGRPLVGTDGAHQLGIVSNGGKLGIDMDPYTQPIATNQLTSGTVGGLMDFQTQAASVLDNLNRLAVGFSVAVNNQSMQGVDLNGKTGSPMFSTDGLTAAASPTNLGTAKVAVSVTNAASLTNATYAVSYNGSNDTWTVKSSEGKTVSGTDQLSLDGINFSFDGQPKDGDTYSVTPLLAAASSMRFLSQSTADIAVALPLNVNPASTNAGSATLTPLKRTIGDPSAQLPTAASLFNSSNAVNNFLRNGAAFILPASSSTATLSSLGTLSAIHFNASGSDISSLNQPSAAGASNGLNLTLSVNGSNPIMLALQPTGSGIGDIAAAINAAANQQGDANSFYASVTNGVLSINALGSNSVSGGAISGFTSAGAPATIKGVDEPGASAADLQIFTREGRQLSGPPLTDAQAKAFLTTANGFLPEAAYAPPSATVNYPNLNLIDTSSLLRVSTASTSTTIDVTAQPSFNTSQAGAGQSIAAGAVYAMNVDGLAPVRMAGGALAGEGDAVIATGLAQQMNAQATRQTLLGPDVNFNNLQSQTIAFTVSIDGASHQVTFHRGVDQNGQPLNTGTFDLGGATDLQVNLVPDPANANASRVMVTLPQTLRSTPPAVTIAPLSTTASSDMTAMGLTSSQMTTNLTGSGAISPSVLNAPGVSIDVTDSTGTRSITIHGASGTETPTVPGQSPISWSYDGKHLTLSSSDQSLQITSDSVSARDAAKSLGFIGSDLNLSLESTVTSANELTPSLLAARSPTLAVSGGQIGNQIITINSPNGSSNGVSWSLVAGKLQLTSSDPTMQINITSPQNLAMASALGFTGGEAAGTQITASQDAATSLIAAQGMPLTVSDASGDKNITINSLNGSDPASGVSWSYDGKRLTLSSANAGFEVKTASINANASASALGFAGAGADHQIDDARLRLTSTVTDRPANTALVDSSASVSNVGTSLTFAGGVPEDLIVAVNNTDLNGKRMVAANIAGTTSATATTSAAQSASATPNLQVKILAGGQLEILDPATGQSLANRTWQQDTPITYQGTSFTIHGDAQPGDLFTISDNNAASTDNRNAVQMANLATTAIFGQGQGSFQDVYAGVAASFGSAVQSANLSAGAATQAASDLKSAYDSATGVNLDSEASDLIKFQQNYQAAAQVIQAARDMFNEIIADLK